MARNCLFMIFLMSHTVVALFPSLEFEMDVSIYDSMPFVTHTGEGIFDNYLARNLPYEPILALKNQISQSFNVELKSRGEAHITVITPPEYQNLKSHLNIERINQLVREQIQRSTFEIVCLGRVQKNLGGKFEASYFVVVKSDELLRLRAMIKAEFINSGGDAERFHADHYFPHITVGFTARDLHFEDGVVKDENSCISNLSLVP